MNFSLFQCNVDENGLPTNVLDDEASKFCQKITNTPVKTVEDFKNSSKLYAVIIQAIHRANLKAVAKPHKVQRFRILPLDLSIAGGELGPTLKLKRHYIVAKYADEISQMYDCPFSYDQVDENTENTVQGW